MHRLNQEEHTHSAEVSRLLQPATQTDLAVKLTLLPVMVMAKHPWVSFVVLLLWKSTQMRQ